MLDALIFEHAAVVLVSRAAHGAEEEEAHALVQLVYEGGLHDLWLLGGGGSADGRRRVAIGGGVARVGGSFSLRLGL